MEKNKSNGRKIFFIFLPFIIIFGILINVVLVIGITPFSFVDTSLPKNDYSNFLRLSVEKNPLLKEAPINRIAMLGTHDSFSYNINMLSKPNINEPDNIVNTPIINILGKGMMVRFAKAQAHSVYDQLEKGVRMLDVRITCVDNKFYTSHGLISETLENSFIQILKFLNKNPGEIVFVEILHNFLGKASIDYERETIANIKYENKNLYDYVNYDVENENDFRNLTYNDITAKGTKGGVVLLDDKYYKEGKYKEYFKLTSMLGEGKHNYYHPNQYKEMIEEHYNRLPELDDKLTTNGIAITTSAKHWWYLISGISLLHQAEKSNLNLLNDPDFEKYLTKMPIISCDFATQTKGDFNKRINEKLLEYNSKLFK